MAHTREHSWYRNISIIAASLMLVLSLSACSETETERPSRIDGSALSPVSAPDVEHPRTTGRNTDVKSKNALEGSEQTAGDPLPSHRKTDTGATSETSADVGEGDPVLPSVNEPLPSTELDDSLAIDEPEPESDPEPDPVEMEEKQPPAWNPLDASVMGETCLPAEALARTFSESGATYPSESLSQKGAGTLLEFCNLCIEESKNEGVRAEVLFAQAMHETGWLQFGGQVDVSQCNYGGLGATNDGAAGASFQSVREGIRAQVQHLKAYASTDALVGECVDPRFDLVARGSAKTVHELGGKWAVPGTTYGTAILSIMERMAA